MQSRTPLWGGSYGNLSFRIKPGEDAFIITGSKIGLKNSASNDCFVKVNSVDLETGIVYAEGVREPSSESMLHFAIYQSRPDVNAIFHGHCPEILCYSKKSGITETQEEKPYGTIDLVQQVLYILKNESFIIMKNHGFISLGKNMKKVGSQTLNILERCHL